jgi:hypothetical protein
VRSAAFLLLLAALAAAAQPYRRFPRTPYYKGPDDPERNQIRGTLKLGETVVLEVPGGADAELKPGVVPDPHVTKPRGSRRPGPFFLEASVEIDATVTFRVDSAQGFPTAGNMNNRGFRNERAYVTCQIGIPKSLRRTGRPFEP